MTKQNLKQVKGPLRLLPYSCDTRVKFFEKGPPIPQVGGVIYSNIYKRMANYIFIARMSLTGVGCRLQTCSRLASERFNSAFCAPIFTWEQTLKKKTTKIYVLTSTMRRVPEIVCAFSMKLLISFFFSIYFLSFPFSNYATCTGNRMCFFYEALYLLFFFPFTFCPSHFPSEPHPLSRQLFIVWIEACSTLTNRFPCLKLISCNNINKLCHLIALFFPQIAAEREWLPLEASSHATIAHSDILLIVFEKRNFIAKALG